MTSARILVASALPEAIRLGYSVADQVKSPGKAACQSIKRARSGHAVDAVRERSTDAPTRRDRTGFAVGSFVSLTPARWDAKRVAGQSRRDIGAGVRFCSRTGQNRLQNQQVIEITSQSARFLRFCDFASRDAHAHVCAITRASRARVLPEPQNHSAFPFINKALLVLEAVLAGSALEPHGVTAATSTLFRRFSNKLAGEYAGHALLTGSSGSFRAAGGETFGVLEAGALAIGGLGERIGICARASGKNGGFPAFSMQPPRDVGRAMLEAIEQRDGFPPFLAYRRQPVRLTGRGGHRSPRRPPAPPFAPARSSSTAAHEACRIWVEHRVHEHDGLMTTRLGRDRLSLNLPTGPGEKSLSPKPLYRGDAGGGVGAAKALRRCAGDNGGRGHVN